MKGHFITFEGIDGCGKSTQIQLVAEWLQSYGVEAHLAFEPGDGELCRQIRDLLLDGSHTPVAEAELFLFLADRAQHVRTVIEPALNNGAWVLCDRYTDSTLAYQLAGRRLVADEIQGLLAFAELSITPDLTLWIDLPVADALERMHARARQGEKNTRLDEESVAFHERVYQGFLRISKQYPDRIRHIDGNGSLEEVQDQIRQAIKVRFGLK